MALNKSNGNMYLWITHTWNPLAGECPHGCTYCYINDLMSKPNIRNKYSGPPRIRERELKTRLGSGRTVFVQNCSDLFAAEVPDEAVKKILDYLNEYPDNTYLLQTKNPGRFVRFVSRLPPKRILATTIETNRSFAVSDAPTPSVKERYVAMRLLPGRKMVSIEPVMDFDPKVMAIWMHEIQPDFVSIGADSKGNGLPEPPMGRVTKLIDALETFTSVVVKSNLKRLEGANESTAVIHSR